MHPLPPSVGDLSPIEIRPDLCGRPAPRLRGSALEVADVILALRDHGHCPTRTADELALTPGQVLACTRYHRQNRELVDERIVLCDLSLLVRPDALCWEAG